MEERKIISKILPMGTDFTQSSRKTDDGKKTQELKLTAEKLYFRTYKYTTEHPTNEKNTKLHILNQILYMYFFHYFIAVDNNRIALQRS